MCRAARSCPQAGKLTVLLRARHRETAPPSFPVVLGFLTVVTAVVGEGRVAQKADHR